MVRYHLDDLGWLQFEYLSQSLVKATLGVGVESWGGHSDRGRDAFYEGTLSLDAAGPQHGRFVFQAKFVAGANGAGAQPRDAVLAAVRKECAFIRKRNESIPAQPTHYVLLTNAPLTADTREALKAAFAAEFRGATVIPWGANDICDLLDTSPRIRVAFPQLLGIRDLENLLANVLHRTVAERSACAYGEARDLSTVFVPTRAYYQALSVLDRHHFVVLTGPPEMGKTTIARMIGLAKLTQGWGYFDCATPKDFFDNLSGDESKVFVADDAFGTTEYRPELAAPWGQQLAKILRAVSSRRWLIWTSRPAPLHLALSRIHLEGNAEQFPSPGQVQVDASQLETLEKAQILYRHSKASGLDDAGRALVKSYASRIVTNSHFTPERVRRFVRDRIPHILRQVAGGHKALDAIDDAVAAEISAPTRRMQQSFDNLEGCHRHVLVAMLDAGTDIVSSNGLARSFRAIFGEHDGMPAEKLLADLDGHFIRRPSAHELLKGHLIPRDNQEYFSWIHPSWRDIAIEFLCSHSAVRRAFLSRALNHGLGLALSIGGGETGERATPLLVDEDAWDALRQNLAHTCQEAPMHRVSVLFVMLRDAIDHRRSEANALNVSRLETTAEQFLEAFRRRLAQSSGGTSVDALQKYYSLAERCGRFVASPDLEATWQSYLEAIADCDDETSPADVYENMDAMIKLVGLLEMNEPRFVRMKGFPKSCESILRRGLDGLRRFATGDDEWMDDPESDIGFIEVVKSLADEVGERCEPLLSLSEDLGGDLESLVDGLQERMKAKEAEKALETGWEEWEEYEYVRREAPTLGPSVPRPRESLPFESHLGVSRPPTIEEVFEDL